MEKHSSEALLLMVPCELSFQKLRSWCATGEMLEGLEAN